MEEEWKTNAAETSPHCPRCGSSNTKFCYYNNYSLTQPRYFCKGCRRYWTKGGSLRNVPVGGGCRKTQRGKSLRSSSNDHRASSSKNLANGVASNCPRPHSSYANSTSIDLAVVYANFLNPSNNAFSDTILSHGPTVDIHSNNNNNNEKYFCELGSFQKQQETSNNNGLPPLPGEEVSTWLSSDQMMVPVHNQLQPTRFSGGIEEEAQDLNQLVGDHWIPFDLPSYDTFSTGLK